MFEIFNKKKEMPRTGSDLASEGLKIVSDAIKKNAISLQQGKLSDDIYLHVDNVATGSRFTYVMASPSVQNEVISRCAFIIDRVQGEIPIWQMDWAVLPQYQKQGFGIAIAAKALAEFTNGMCGKFDNGFFIEAVVDEQNKASRKIAEKVLGNEKILLNKATGVNVHNFLKRFDA